MSKTKDLRRLEEISKEIPKLLHERRRIWKRRSPDTTLAELGRASGVTRAAVGKALEIPDDEFKAGVRSGRPKES